MATTSQRGMLANLMDYLISQEPKVHYAEVRPMRSRSIRTVEQLHVVVESPQGLTMDCSEAVTLLCKLAGLHDPNGLDYDGEGFTGTLLGHLAHYLKPGGAQTGALVVFGPGSGDHVCMVRRPDPHDPVLWSHGQERGPLLVRLSVEAAAHRAPVTFLSIAPL